MIHKRWENNDHGDYAQRITQIHTITMKNKNLGESLQGSKLVPDEKMAGMHAL